MYIYCLYDYIAAVAVGAVPNVDDVTNKEHLFFLCGEWIHYKLI